LLSKRIPYNLVLDVVTPFRQLRHLSQWLFLS
jgi:hypothetical protein